MKRTIFLIVLGSLVSGSAYCWSPTPKSQTRFYCSDDAKSLMVTDGTNVSTVESNMVDWSSGLPQPGCTQEIVNEVTAKGFYCDGHFLTDYKGNQQDMGLSENCQSSLASKPDISWN